MSDVAGPQMFRLVLIPAGQVTGDGCKPGFVKLTGTPGEGSWDEWGPYRSAGEFGAREAGQLAGALENIASLAMPPPSC